MKVCLLAFAAGVAGLCRQTQSSPGQVLLPFCWEHNSRTCCSKTQALQVYSRIQKVGNAPLVFQHEQDFDRFDHSRKCLEVTETVFCSVCDADVGEDILSGICPNLCESWYDACKSDLFQAGLTSDSIELCTDGSLYCSQLRSITKEPEEFCGKIGYPVRRKKCFGGVSAAMRKGPAGQKTEEKIESSYWQYVLYTLIGVMGASGFFWLQRRLLIKEVDVREARLRKLEQK